MYLLALFVFFGPLSRVRSALYYDVSFFFFNDTATTEIYTLSLHDALPICGGGHIHATHQRLRAMVAGADANTFRSEEHTSELQSRLHLVCRLLLEKKKTEHEITKRQKRRALGHHRILDAVIGHPAPAD